jgi:hypothetical protein
MAGSVAIAELTADFRERLARLPGRSNLIPRNPADPIPFARVLAKIAHLYAMAKLGPQGFRPLLNDLILGRGRGYPAHFVGSIRPRRNRPDPPSRERHWVSIGVERRIDGRPFLVVRIRLFGEYQMLMHRVVVGEPTTEAEPYRATDEHPIAILRLFGRLTADGEIDPPNPVLPWGRYPPTSIVAAQPALQAPRPMSKYWERAALNRLRPPDREEFGANVCLIRP